MTSNLPNPHLLQGFGTDRLTQFTRCGTWAHTSASTQNCNFSYLHCRCETLVSSSDPSRKLPRLLPMASCWGVLRTTQKGFQHFTVGSWSFACTKPLICGKSKRLWNSPPNCWLPSRWLPNAATTQPGPSGYFAPILPSSAQDFYCWTKATPLSYLQPIKLYACIVPPASTPHQGHKPRHCWTDNNPDSSSITQHSKINKRKSSRTSSCDVMIGFATTSSFWLLGLTRHCNHQGRLYWLDEPTWLEHQDPPILPQKDTGEVSWIWK